MICLPLIRHAVFTRASENQILTSDFVFKSVKQSHFIFIREHYR